MKNDTIGVDVSKDHLDAHRLADGATRRFANDKGGHKALIKWLAEMPANRVVFEPTGPYHRAIERALGASDVPSSRSIRVRCAVSLRRPASWRRPIAWMRPFWLAWARCWNSVLASIPGVSNITAFALLIEMPELGALEAGQAASLVGLDRAPVRTLDRARLHSRWSRRPATGALSASPRRRSLQS